MRRRGRSATIIVLATSLLCWLPQQVGAAPRLTVTLEDTPDQHRDALEAGRQAVLAGDAEEAVGAWSRILASTPEGVQTREFRAKLVVDIISVALEAHRREPEVALLESALETYYGYFAAHEDQYGNPNIPGSVVEARFALKAALEESRDAPSPAKPPPPPAAVITSTSDVYRGHGTGLMIAGGVTLGVGAGLSSLIAVGAINRKNTRRDLDNPAYSDAQRVRIREEEQKANAMFIAGLVSTPVALATGGVLLGVGAKRRKSVRRSYAQVSAMIDTRRAGLQVSGRF